MSAERQRLIFSGAGGQGVVTAAILLGEAAVLHEGLNAVQTQTYGPEARGGTARADLILSSGEIRFPRVIQPNILVCLSQDAYLRYGALLRPGGLLITDSGFVRQNPGLDARQVELPFHSTAVGMLGSEVVQNVCMLGALLALTEVLRSESLRQAVRTRFAGEARELNLKALEVGLRLGAAAVRIPG